MPAKPRAPDRIPTHPGAILREDVLPALRLSVTAAAEALQISRQTLHKLLAEQAGVSPEMALRLGKLCGNGAAIWLRMQQERDLYLARRELAPVLDRIPTLDAA